MSVYFVQARGTDMVKIGSTRQATAASRIRDMQTGCPVPLQELFVLDGGVKLEGELHERFRDYRVQGEWFRAEGALRAFMAEHCDIDGPEHPIDRAYYIVLGEARRVMDQHLMFAERGYEHAQSEIKEQLFDAHRSLSDVALWCHAWHSDDLYKLQCATRGLVQEAVELHYKATVAYHSECDD